MALLDVRAFDNYSWRRYYLRERGGKNRHNGERANVWKVRMRERSPGEVMSHFVIKAECRAPAVSAAAAFSWPIFKIDLDFWCR